MVIETYTAGPGPVYARAAERGRMLPVGLAYRNSWIDERTLDRCFQPVECGLHSAHLKRIVEMRQFRHQKMKGGFGLINAASHQHLRQYRQGGGSEFQSKIG